MLRSGLSRGQFMTDSVPLCFFPSRYAFTACVWDHWYAQKQSFFVFLKDTTFKYCSSAVDSCFSFLRLRVLLLSSTCQLSLMLLRTHCTPWWDMPSFWLTPLGESPCWYKKYYFVPVKMCYLAFFIDSAEEMGTNDVFSFYDRLLATKCIEAI